MFNFLCVKFLRPVEILFDPRGLRMTMVKIL